MSATFMLHVAICLCVRPTNAGHPTSSPNPVGPGAVNYFYATPSASSVIGTCPYQHGPPSVHFPQQRRDVYAMAAPTISTASIDAAVSPTNYEFQSGDLGQPILSQREVLPPSTAVSSSYASPYEPLGGGGGFESYLSGTQGQQYMWVAYTYGLMYERIVY